MSEHDDKQDQQQEQPREVHRTTVVDRGNGGNPFAWVVIVIIIAVVVFGAWWLFMSGEAEPEAPETGAPIDLEITVPGEEDDLDVDTEDEADDDAGAEEDVQSE